MRIKTIIRRLDNAEDFDREVNGALADGWALTERKVLQPAAQPINGGAYFRTMLYAELEKADGTEEGSPVLDLIANLAKFAGVMAENAKKEGPAAELVENE